MQVSSHDPLLVINADILTNLDLSAMYHTHCTYNNAITVAVRKIENKVPYGVMDLQKGKVLNVAEKPVQTYFINAGIYVLSPEIAASVGYQQKCDMTDLIAEAVVKDLNVHSFPIHEQWMDVGNMSDYLRVKNATQRAEDSKKLTDLSEVREKIEF
jgi:NDP-sugar pyrophosphorylase family protein